MKIMLVAVFCMSLLLAACSAPPEPVDYPEMGSAQFNNYHAQCSQCHAPARPSAHTAAEWPSVIARMQDHRIESRIPPMLASESIAVRDYLIAHARAE
ncbi:MAG: hypothetical protein R8K50_08375 [Mariprofundus sp.]